MWWIVRTRRRSRGTILVAAIVCMVLAMMMIGAVVSGLMIQHRQSRVDQQCLQSLWLAESGAARAAAALAADASYSGEIWQVSVPTAAGPVAGSVEIVVRAAADPSAGREVQIQARWPHNTLTPVSYRRQLVIPRAEQGDAS